MDPTVIVQAFLFAFFAGLTAILSVIIGPTYDNLFVPEMSAGSLYPTLPLGGGGTGFLATAATFSDYLLANLVDPVIVLVAVGIGLLYLARAVLGREEVRFQGALPKLIGAVILANFAVPVAGLLLSVGAATYPVVAGFDGGSWQHWTNLAGFGEIYFTWDNGALAFVVSFALFSVVLLLAMAIALRDALLAVLLVLLPILTLLWPIPALAPLARRAWMLFGELVFLPCVLVVPLELAVGSPSVLVLLGYLTVALSSPWLISLAGAQLTGAGFPGAGSVLSGGVQRGLAAGSSSVGQSFGALSRVSRISPVPRRESPEGEGPPTPAAWQGGAPTSSVATARASTPASGWFGYRAVAGAGRLGQLAGRAGFPASAPLVGADLLGRGAAHLLRHVGARLPKLRDGFGPLKRTGKPDP